MFKSAQIKTQHFTLTCQLNSYGKQLYIQGYSFTFLPHNFGHLWSFGPQIQFSSWSQVRCWRIRARTYYRIWVTIYVMIPMMLQQNRASVSKKIYQRINAILWYSMLWRCSMILVMMLSAMMMLGDLNNDARCYVVILNSVKVMRIEFRCNKRRSRCHGSIGVNTVKWWIDEGSI